MQQQIDQRKVHLQSLMNGLNSSIVDSEKRYFHINSVENLIFHFEDIKSENDKEWVYAGLLEYLKECAENSTSIDRTASKYLFYEYIDKIADYYQNHLGFVTFLNRAVIYLFYFLVLAVCYFLFHYYILIGVAAFIFFQIARTFIKYKGKQVYGLFW
jgi:hypothetical protein